MKQFLLDENIPYTLKKVFVQYGYSADHVRDAGLTGKTDKEITEWINVHDAILITRDIEFAYSFYLNKSNLQSVLLLRTLKQSSLLLIEIVSRLHRDQTLQALHESQLFVIASEESKLTYQP